MRGAPAHSNHFCGLQQVHVTINVGDLRAGHSSPGGALPEQSRGERVLVNNIHGFQPVVS